MMAALKAVNEGKLALDQPVPMEAKYQNNDSGCFQHLSSDFVIQLRDALIMMIIVSDNTCTGAVADRVGLEPINVLCQGIGMTGTTHRYGIPPAGMAGYLPAEKTNAPPRQMWACCSKSSCRALKMPMPRHAWVVPLSFAS